MRLQLTPTTVQGLVGLSLVAMVAWFVSDASPFAFSDAELEVPVLSAEIACRLASEHLSPMAPKKVTGCRAFQTQGDTAWLEVDFRGEAHRSCLLKYRRWLVVESLSEGEGACPDARTPPEARPRHRAEFEAEERKLVEGLQAERALTVQALLLGALQAAPLPTPAPPLRCEGLVGPLTWLDDTSLQGSPAHDVSAPVFAPLWGRTPDREALRTLTRLLSHPVPIAHLELLEREWPELLKGRNRTEGRLSGSLTVVEHGQARCRAPFSVTLPEWSYASEPVDARRHLLERDMRQAVRDAVEATLTRMNVRPALGP
jgi:hypothetical protein